MTTRVENAFLPAAIELERTPASPLGRTTMLVIIALFVLAVVWASLGHVDIVAVAPGTVIASGKSKTIQPLETGQVAAIEVEEGQRVAHGQVLVQLDDTIARAELHRLDAALADAARDIQRFDTLLHWVSSAGAVAESKPAVTDMQLRDTWNEHVARVDVLHREKDRLIAEKASAAAQTAKLAAILPIIERRSEDRRRLVDKQLLAENDYLETEQRRLETQHDLRSQRSHVTELDATIAELEARVEVQTSQFMRHVADELEKARRQHKALNQERIKAQARLAATTVRSPIDGTVQQLAVHHRGAVVTPAQALMVMVPSGESLEVEAALENKDIGFVEVGQRVEVKVDAFPFTRYGLIEGRVVGLSSDAVVDERKGMVFTMRVELDQSGIEVNGDMVSLSPGMTVSVEAMTGKRRLIEYVLSPLLRYRDESVRER
ncbi:MAG: HlyD family type I secretion periplasmic adaptor subunit [Chromatiaceae bacterium]|jgi:hemolysin D